MSRKNESPQKAAMREMMKNYLKDADLSIQDAPMSKTSCAT